MKLETLRYSEWEDMHCGWYSRKQHNQKRSLRCHHPKKKEKKKKNRNELAYHIRLHNMQREARIILAKVTLQKWTVQWATVIDWSDHIIRNKIWLFFFFLTYEQLQHYMIKYVSETEKSTISYEQKAQNVYQFHITFQQRLVAACASIFHPEIIKGTEKGQTNPNPTIPNGRPMNWWLHVIQL